MQFPKKSSIMLRVVLNKERYRVKMKKMRTLALLLCGALAVSMFAGCGKEIDKTATVATLGETEVSLGVANFAARLQQAQYDDFYVAYMGEEVWRTDMYGNGVTMQENLKSSVMESLYVLYALEANMAEYNVTITDADKTAIAEAAAAFMSDNSAEAIDALGATNEIVEEYLTLLTVQSRMYDEIVKAADTNVSDEEANTSAYSYVYISKETYTDAEGNSVEYTEEELTALAEEVNVLAANAKVGNLETVVGEKYTVSTSTYHADDTMAEALKTALSSMADGDVELVEIDTAYYILRMDAVVDEEATQTKREDIIEDRKSAVYTEVVEGYQEALTWIVNEKVWEQVSFDNLFTVYEPSTESVGTESTEQ